MVKSDYTGKYSPLDDEIIDEGIRNFDILYTSYCNSVFHVGYIADARYERDEIAEIFKRVDKRKHYFDVFHNMPSGPNQIKTAALFCFWLLKYRPLTVVFRDRTKEERVKDSPEKKKYDNEYTYFTENFCLYMMNGICKSFNGSPVKASKYYMEDFIYNLRNADISKEAMIMLFEALIPAPQI